MHTSQRHEKNGRRHVIGSAREKEKHGDLPRTRKRVCVCELMGVYLLFVGAYVCDRSRGEGFDGVGGSGGSGILHRNARSREERRAHTHAAEKREEHTHTQ